MSDNYTRNLLTGYKANAIKGHDSYLGFYMELRKSLLDVKRMAQVGNTHKAYGIDASKDDGWCCSSEETFVMRVERITPIIRLLVG